MKKNDIITVTITDISFDGQGIGRSECGVVVFVKEALIGETVKVHILKALKNTAYGKVTEYIKRSPERCEPLCPVFSKCGGCAYMFTNYKNELNIKRNSVRNALRTIAGLDCEVLPTVFGDEYGYRNKMLVPVSKDKNGKIRAGFFRKNSHDVIPMEKCCVSHGDFEKIIDAILKFCEKYNVEPYSEETKTGVIRHIYLRRGYHTGEIMAGAVINKKKMPHSDEFVRMIKETGLNVVSIMYNINEKDTNVILGDKTEIIYKKPHIEDTMLGNRFCISAPAFYQVNTPMAEKLYEIALSKLDENDKTVFDLYSGAGTITLAIAKRAERVIGIESCEPAVENAVYNAQINGIKNAEFICGEAEKEIFTLLNSGIMPDAVVLDPPRSGCDKKLIDALLKLKPKKIIYVSCNPATMARDIKLLSENYEVKSVQPVDLFPKTHHVECCVQLCRT